MCSIPEAPPPPVAPSEVGKSAAGSLTTIDKASKSRNQVLSQKTGYQNFFSQMLGLTMNQPTNPGITKSE